MYSLLLFSPLLFAIICYHNPFYLSQYLPTTCRYFFMSYFGEYHITENSSKNYELRRANTLIWNRAKTAIATRTTTLAAMVWKTWFPERSNHFVVMLWFFIWMGGPQQGQNLRWRTWIGGWHSDSDTWQDSARPAPPGADDQDIRPTTAPSVFPFISYHLKRSSSIQ